MSNFILKTYVKRDPINDTYGEHAQLHVNYLADISFTYYSRIDSIFRYIRAKKKHRPEAFREEPHDGVELRGKSELSIPPLIRSSSRNTIGRILPHNRCLSSHTWWLNYQFHVPLALLFIWNRSATPSYPIAISNPSSSCLQFAQFNSSPLTPSFHI